jgi:hypothetical protein
LLRSSAFTDIALVPASPWLDRTPPAAPTMNITLNPLKVNIGATERPGLWALHVKRQSGWKLQILPGRFNGFTFDPGDEPDAIALRAIDRCGNESAPTVVARN